MKKIFLLLAVITVCAIAYFNMGPEEKEYMDESEVLAYLNMGSEEQQFMDESDVQAYTPTDVMKDRDLPRKKKTRYYAVKNHKPRKSTLGFSITPPPGSNWYEKLEGNSLYYVKINKLHKQYVILTEAREVHLSKNIRNPTEILGYVKMEKEKSLASSKFKKPNLTVQMAASLSESCVRYSRSYEDHGVKELHGRRYVNVDTQGLFCLHPGNARVGIDVNYVEKSLSNTLVKSYSSEGELFIVSLKFH